MSTKVPPFPTIPNGATSQDFGSWLDMLTGAFRSAQSPDGAKSNRFLVKLKMLSELAEGGARLLSDALHEPAEHLAQAVTQLELCSTRARELDEEMASLLARSIITPFDSEDLKSMSTHLTRLVAATRDVAREVLACNRVEQAYVRLQDRIVECHVTAGAVIAALDGEYRDPLLRLWSGRRAAKALLREERMTVMSDHDTMRVVAAHAIFKRFATVLAVLKQLNMSVYWTGYKNG